MDPPFREDDERLFNSLLSSFADGSSPRAGHDAATLMDARTAGTLVEARRRGRLDLHQPMVEALRARLAELEVRVDGVEDDLRHPLEADSLEQAVDLADDEALAGVSDVLRREIAETRVALARAEQGQYGLCERCGQRISPERLKALPTATRCISCT